MLRSTDKVDRRGNAVLRIDAPTGGHHQLDDLVPAIGQAKYFAAVSWLSSAPAPA